MTKNNLLSAPGDRELFLETLIKQSKDGILVIDQGGLVLFANPAAKEMFANQEEDLVGYQIGMPAIQDDVELRLPRGDEIRTVEMRASHMTWEGQRVHLVTLRDVTEREKARERIQESEEKFRHLFEHSINGFALHQIITDEDGNPVDYVYLDVNQAFEDHTGLHPEDIVGKRASEIFGESEELDLIDVYGKVAVSGEATQFDFYSPQLKRSFLVSAYSPQEGQFATIFYDISERIQAEKALKRSEEKFRTLYETMSQGVVYQNSEGEFTSANPAAQRILGLSLDQMQGKTSLDPDWKAVDLDGNPLPGEQHPAMVALRTGEKVENFVFGVYQPEQDEHVWISVSAVPQFKAGEDEPYQVFTTFLDISERVRAEKDLRERVKELRCIAAVSTTIQREPTLEELGQKTVELLTPAMQHPEITVPVVAIDGQRFESDRYHPGLTHNLRAEISGKQGSHGFVSVYYSEDKPFLIPEEQDLLDRIAEMLGLWHEQAQAQRKLRKSQEQLDLAIQSAELGIWDWNLVEDSMTFNELFVDMLGYRSDEVEEDANFWRDHVHPDDRDEVQDAIHAHINGETPIFQVRHRALKKDGEVISVLDTGKVMERTTDGEPVRFMGVNKEITELVQAEEELRQSEKKYRNLFASIRDAILITNTDREIIDCNPAFTDIFGYKLDEIRGKQTVYVYQNEEQYQELGRMLDKHSADGNFFYTVNYRKKSGEVFPGETNVFYLEDDEGEVVAYVGLIRDITQRKEHERVIERHVERLSIQHQIASMGVKTNDQDQIIEKTTALIMKTFAPQSGGILLFDEQKGKLEPHPSYHIDEEYRTVTVRLGEGIVGRVAESGEPLNISNVKEIEEYREVNPEAMSELCVPVQSNQQLWGVINIESDEVNAFSAEDENMLITAANQLATVLDKVHSVRKSQRRMERLRALREIDQTISGSLDLEMTLNVMVDQMIEHLEVDAGAILLYQPQLQQMEYVSGTGFRTDEITQTTHRLGEDFAGKVVFQRQMIHVPDLTLETIRSKYGEMIRKERFKSYCGVPLIAKGEVVGVMEVFHRSKLDPPPEWIEFLETLAGQAAIAIDRLQLFNDLERSNIDLVRAYNEVIEGWARALELRDQETEGHSRRVEQLTLEMARRMGMGGEKLAHVRQGSLLHDIGKMGIPDQILHKPGKLSEEEWALMRKHPTFAYEMLSPIDHLQPALDIPYCHHEKWDGSGYPRGLQGEEIPLAARIFAIVDVWDALRSDRPYRDAWSDERALDYIKEQSGEHFDPQVVDVFLKIVNS